MSSSLVLFHNPHSATTTPTLPNTIFTITSSFRPRRSSSSSSSSSSTNRIFPTNQPKPIIKKLQTQTLAARDTIIDFGKHKGKQLGTLPSTYLKWVSKNLRAGDSEYWAKLADEVLNDDVYKDKIEWEFAEKILHGSNETIKNREEVNSVSMLLEVSERFGWDNEDKIGWSKINFELLGTSKGGRIPRLKKTNQEDEKREEMVRRRRRREIKKKEEEEDGNGWRRRERRERMRQSFGREKESDNQKGILGRLEDTEMQIEPKIHSPFPGRESLLKKVMNKKKIQ